MMIREANPSDAAAVVEFFRVLRAERLPTLFNHDSAPTLIEMTILLEKASKAENSTFLMALEGDQVVGNLEIAGAPHPQVRHVGRLGMSVLEGSRGRGVGTALLRSAISWASSAGISRIELDVVENNPDAIRLYQRLGFSVDCRRRGAFLVGSSYLDIIQMSRVLPG